MTPDKNTTSENTVDDTLDDANDNQDLPADSGVELGETDTAAQADDVDDKETVSETAAEDASNAADSDLNADGAADDGDPMGFGDQRMGDESADDEPLDEMGQLQVQLAEAEAKAADYWDRLLRLQADMENQRKRAQNDVTKARKFALDNMVGDLLPVKDSLEMGLAAAEAEDADPKAIVEGADLTLKMLAQVFEKNNIAEINPVDEKFDPEFHQAMSMQEIEGKDANTVAMVMQKGYTLNERLVRPALVMVAK